MNPKRIMIALTLALLVSATCTWMVAKRLSRPAVVKKIPDASYVAPARALQAGELLKADNIEMVAWPGSDPVDGAFTRTADLIGREVLYPLGQGQPILNSDLSAPGSGTGLAGKIPDGMRAVALRSDEIVGVAGFLVPGSHLDVLVTYSAGGTVGAVTATVLQDAVVIATGQQIEPDPGGKPAPPVTVVTLLLTPEESERAVLASTQGAIHFVLRNGGDSGRTQGAPMQLSELLGQTAASTVTRRLAPVPAAPISPTLHHEIETVLGDGSVSAGTAAIPVGGARP